MERADELKTAILSSVSHDLRTPLTAIKAAVESLRDGEIDWSNEDRASFLETIEGQTDRLTATVSDLLEMSRLDGHAVTPSSEAIEVVPLLEEARAGAVFARQIQVEAPAGLWLRADYHLLLQALGNLLENADRYSAPGSLILLEARAEKATVRIDVADYGPGIPAADLPHIFEKFYRGKQNAEIKGSGLGLAIVKAMVELCSGSVAVSSSGSGTRFTIELPAARAPQS